MLLNLLSFVVMVIIFLYNFGVHYKKCNLTTVSTRNV
jgi:hypothetical protein